MGHVCWGGTESALEKEGGSPRPGPLLSWATPASGCQRVSAGGGVGRGHNCSVGEHFSDASWKLLLWIEGHMRGDK